MLKYIQKEIISLFNSGKIKVLFSTTTITEGVNRSAKNLIVLHAKKGIKELKKFDAKNIAGRAGRFLHHYSGRVIVLDEKFIEAIENEENGIKHKNYDKDSPKDEIDLFYTNEEYLLPKDKEVREEIKKLQRDRGIPDYIFEEYAVISRRDKIELYDNLLKFDILNIREIKNLIMRINSNLTIDNDGFQLIINHISFMIKDNDLNFFIDRKDKNNKYSILVYMISSYLGGGFTGTMNYNIDKIGLPTDKAIRKNGYF